MLGFQNTKLSIRRPLTDYSKIQWLIGKVLRNRRSHINRRRIQRLQYLNAGCGPNVHDDFINIDWSWRPGIDICWDLTRGIPLQDATLAGVFSEHCLEHMSLDDSRKVVSEFRRILKPRGTVRVSVPDGGHYLNVYAQRELNSKNEQREPKFPYEDSDRLSELYSPMVSVNRIARDSGHLYLFDFSLLKLVFEAAGFVEVTRTKYMQGREPRLLVDSPNRVVESLYVEAVAP